MAETKEELYVELTRMLQEEDFNNLVRFLKNEESKGYMKIHDIGHTSIKFAVGQPVFIIRAAIRPYQRRINYETFLLQLNGEDYPNEKLTRVAELDMVTDVNESRSFKVAKTITLSPPTENRKEPITITTTDIDKKHFGEMYIEQVENYLKQNTVSTVWCR